ncbi:MAG TPA: hypothetical protein VFF88_10805 [Methylocella sp.]|nr:hypothetical protein [Methylocella sp.]
MCTAIEERIRIEKILMQTVSLRLENRPADLTELTQLCIAALQLYYSGACPDECLEARARNFAAWELARWNLAQKTREASSGFPSGGQHAKSTAGRGARQRQEAMA